MGAIVSTNSEAGGSTNGSRSSLPVADDDQKQQLLEANNTAGLVGSSTNGGLAEGVDDGL